MKVSEPNYTWTLFTYIRIQCCLTHKMYDSQSIVLHIFLPVKCLSPTFYKTCNVSKSWSPNEVCQDGIVLKCVFHCFWRLQSFSQSEASPGTSFIPRFFMLLDRILVLSHLQVTCRKEKRIPKQWMQKQLALKTPKWPQPSTKIWRRSAGISCRDTNSRTRCWSKRFGYIISTCLRLNLFILETLLCTGEG